MAFFNLMTRREMMAGAAALTAAGASGAAFAGANKKNPAPDWMLPLAKNARGGLDETPEIEGKLPADLVGDLYRNGPGLFERDGVVKRHLLDGDGLLQRVSFRGGAAHYRNAFVETEKFLEEEEAGKFLYSTWSTPRPGGPLKNIGGGPRKSQAGVTVYPVGDTLFALDEANPAYRVDPESLATLGARPVGDPAEPVPIKAHAKFDPVKKEWLFVGQSFGRKFDLHAIRCAEDGSHISTQTLRDTRQVYIHDFLATARYFVFLLHPCEMHPAGFLAGTHSVIETLKWNGARGNEIVLLPRDGGEPIRFEAPGAFMWHALNAYEEGDEVVADFVGYDAPDHFIGDKPMLAELMKGHLGAGEHHGKIRRYRMNAPRRKLAEEIVDHGNHEFPMTDPRVALAHHRVGYFAYEGEGPFQSGVKRLDYETGEAQTYLFGEGFHVGEPVFAPRPGGGLDDGWLIAQCLDGKGGRTFFAVFDAQNVNAGPVAKVWLSTSIPISFHGAWRAA